MNPEIDSKSCWVGSRGLQNRVKIGPGTPSGLPTAPKSIPRASRERLGSGSGRPRRVPGAPGGSPRAPRDAQKDAEERPRSHRDSENRRPSTSRSGKIRCRLRDLSAKHCRSAFSSIFLHFRSFWKVCKPSEVLRLPAKTELRAPALRVALRARRRLEKLRKSMKKRRFRGPVDVWLALERRFQGLLDVKLALDRRFGTPDGPGAATLDRPGTVLGHFQPFRPLDDPKSPTDFFV